MKLRLLALGGVLLLAACPTPMTVATPLGIRELSTDTAVRPVLTGLEAGVPETRGPFTFAAPYGTQGYRLTDASDCLSGADCVEPVGYSYWRNLNNSAGAPSLYAVITLSEGPTLFRIHKTTHAVTKVGPLFRADDPHALATGEGWYFSATARTMYYVVDWQALRRLDVETGALTTVFNLAEAFGPSRYLWQAHSSADDRVHTFTVREVDTWRSLGCGVYTEPLGVFRFYPSRRGDFDECQIDPTGRWLLIKEQIDGLWGEDNRLIDVRGDAEQILLDQHGAAGHSDNGRNSLVAWDNWAPMPQIRLWSFSATPPGPGQVVYEHPTWITGALGHLAWASSLMAVGSNASIENGPRANEIVAVRLDGSKRCLVFAPTMTNLDAGSKGGDYYSNLPKANVDGMGQYVMWTTNLGTPRLEAIVARIPNW